MGALCCCMRVVDSDEYENPSSSIYRHRFIRQFLVLYTTVFQRRDLRAAPSIQGATPLPSSGLSAGSIDSSFSETFRAPPMPLPYDADRVASRHEKTSSHIHDESQRHRRGNSISGLESILKTDKFSGSDCEGGFFDRGSTVFCSESSVKHSKFMREVAYFLSSSEDEDVCPTCLEGLYKIQDSWCRDCSKDPGSKNLDISFFMRISNEQLAYSGYAIEDCRRGKFCIANRFVKSSYLGGW